MPRRRAQPLNRVDISRKEPDAAISVVACARSRDVSLLIDRKQGRARRPEEGEPKDQTSRFTSDFARGIRASLETMPTPPKTCCARRTCTRAAASTEADGRSGAIVWKRKPCRRMSSFFPPLRMHC